MKTHEIEASVIGAVMLDERAYWRVADLIDESDFTQYREVWRVVATLARAGKPCDAVTVGDANPEIGKVAVAIANGTPGASAARAYAEILAKRATERRVQTGGERIAKLIGDDVLGEAHRILASCAPRVAASVRRASEITGESLKGVMDRYHSDQPYSGLVTGIEPLDEMTAGLQRGDLVILAARPSIGKTALAATIALHASGRGTPALILSLEMSGAQVTDRCLSHVGHIDGMHIRDSKRMTDEEWPRLTAARTLLDTYPLYIDDTSSLTLDGIGARVRQANAKERLGLVVIDYLGLITPPKAERLTDAIQLITRGLKALARELQLPMLLLCQLNRTDERPTLKSLRDSGAIEQDADVVLFLHRPDDKRPELLEGIVAKQRNGPIGSIWLHADMRHMRFTVTEERPEAGEETGFARRRRSGNPAADKAAA